MDIRKYVRPIITILFGLTLCIIAVAESVGAAILPIWFKVMSGAVLAWWFGERVYRKNKGE